jgi:glutamyl-tRNA reductase
MAQGSLLTCGFSFANAPIEVREKVALDLVEAAQAARYCVGHAGVSGAMVLSTCNRTEWYLTPSAGTTSQMVIDVLMAYCGIESLTPYLIVREGDEAIRHLFRVASGLDSMVVGETQVLGQIKDAHRQAKESGTLDATLDFLVRRAIQSAKTVQTETAIGRQSGNLSDVAIDFLEDAAGGFEGAGVLLLGAGKVSTLAARKLSHRGARLYFSSRSVAAGQLAEAMSGTAVKLDELSTVANQIDFVMCSTASKHAVLTKDAVVEIQIQRSWRDLWMVDLAVPRDIEPEVSELSGVHLFDLDNLGEAALALQQERSAEIAKAEDVLETELSRALGVMAERDGSAEIIGQLVRTAEILRRREVERTVSELGELPPEVRERIDVMTQSLVSKLLHGPITQLRNHSDDPELKLALRETFGLDPIPK